MGAGLAGRATAEALRELDPALPITLVTACSGDVYYKPELSVAFARGLSPETLCREQGAAMARRLNLRLLDCAFAIGVSPATSSLRTTRGTLRYSHLVLAQGARPALPAALPASVAWRVNDLQGWSGLHQRLRGGPKRIAIVGGGMVGCELAEDFVQAGHAVTLLDRNAGPLAGLLPTEASQRLRRRLEAAGIRVIAPVEVREARRDAEGVLITTECGLSVEADELVAATGLTTDTRLARSAGLLFNRGIAIDASTLETSAKGIYALGDCISIDGVPCRFIEPIARQAAAIASHILGRRTEGYAHRAPVVRLKTRSMPLALHGVPHAGGVWRTVRDDADRFEMEQWFAGKLHCRLAA
ncbi:MAG TPA: FAD-dependent oxidoreductase [Acetobacteraceae bacterium]|nr:FAD-dependent oxidoreductase [Acetobacteraceae bacterium]